MPHDPFFNPLSCSSESLHGQGVAAMFEDRPSEGMYTFIDADGGRRSDAITILETKYACNGFGDYTEGPVCDYLHVLIDELWQMHHGGPEIDAYPEAQSTSREGTLWIGGTPA